MNYTLGPLIITKELILNKVSEETLMEHYLGIHVRKGLVKSPLRRDSKPTCSFYRNKVSGRLIFKDWSGAFCGDFLSVVMYKYDCSYGKALQIIANDFNIVHSENLVKNVKTIEYSNTKYTEVLDAVIQVEVKDFNDQELSWWSRYGISLNTLQKFKVFSCRNIFLNNSLYHIYRNNQRVFGYFGGIKGGIERWRIYFSNNKKYRFISNWKSTQLQGSHMLPKSGQYVVVTKSLKDVMVLYEFGIPAIAPISENCYLTEAQHNKLVKRFSHVILLYDNDYAGIKNANKFRKQYSNLYVCWLPRNTAKDISDYYMKYGKEKTQQLINYAEEKITKEELRRKGTS